MTGLGEGREPEPPRDEDAPLDGWSEFPETTRLEAAEPGFLFQVADGMGGAAAGEIASRLAVTTVQEVVDTRWRERGDAAPPAPEEFSRFLRDALLEANHRVHEWSDRHTEYRGMGSTLTAVGLVDRTAVLAHVGDSRAYLYRDERLVQLTEDQTIAQKLVETGRLSPDEAEGSSQAHMLLQALGTEPELRPDLDARPLRAGDRLLLCSDGLSETVTAADIGEVLRRTPDLGRATEALIDRANERGGPDNVTVLLVRVDFGATPDT